MNVTLLYMAIFVMIFSNEIVTGQTDLSPWWGAPMNIAAFLLLLAAKDGEQRRD